MLPIFNQLFAGRGDNFFPSLRPFYEVSPLAEIPEKILQNLLGLTASFPSLQASTAYYWGNPLEELKVIRNVI